MTLAATGDVSRRALEVCTPGVGVRQWRRFAHSAAKRTLSLPDVYPISCAGAHVVVPVSAYFAGPDVNLRRRVQEPYIVATAWVRVLTL